MKLPCASECFEAGFLKGGMDKMPKESWTKCSSFPSSPYLISLQLLQPGQHPHGPCPRSASTAGHPGILWDGLGPHFFAALPGTPRNPAGP